jgi:hypothetical protein
VPSAGSTAVVTVDRVKGIAICTIAAGPLGLLVFLVGLTIGKESLVLAVAEMLEVPLLLFGGGISLVMLPTIVAIAAGNHALGRMDKDGFMASTLAGSIIGYSIVSLTGVILIGEAPGWNLTDGVGPSDATLIILANALLSALYWLVTVRAERNRRKLARERERALRAME